MIPLKRATPTSVDSSVTRELTPFREDVRSPRTDISTSAVVPISSEVSAGESEDSPPAVVGEPSHRTLIAPQVRAEPGNACGSTLRRAIWRRRRAERAEMKRFTALARRRRRTVFASLSAVGALVIFVGVGAFTPLMGLQQIQVLGAERLDTAAVVKALFSQENVPLTLLDEGQIQEALSDFPVIQSYSLETLPPHTLVIRVAERQPVMSRVVSGGFSLVDPAGVVIETQAERPAGYPVASSLPADPRAPAFIAVAAALQAVPADLLPRIDSVTATTADNISFVLVDSGINVIWGSAQDSSLKGVILDRMIAALAAQEVTVIDVSSTEAPVFS
ncbi:cell division protein FtsQ/DivIB [Klugiella xanthotipulae]